MVGLVVGSTSALGLAAKAVFGFFAALIPSFTPRNILIPILFLCYEYLIISRTGMSWSDEFIFMITYTYTYITYHITLMKRRIINWFSPRKPIKLFRNLSLTIGSTVLVRVLAQTLPGATTVFLLRTGYDILTVVLTWKILDECWKYYWYHWTYVTVRGGIRRFYRRSGVQIVQATGRRIVNFIKEYKKTTVAIVMSITALLILLNKKLNKSSNQEEVQFVEAVEGLVEQAIGDRQMPRHRTFRNTVREQRKKRGLASAITIATVAIFSYLLVNFDFSEAVKQMKDVKFFLSEINTFSDAIRIIKEIFSGILGGEKVQIAEELAHGLFDDSDNDDDSFPGTYDVGPEQDMRIKPNNTLRCRLLSRTTNTSNEQGDNHETNDPETNSSEDDSQSVDSAETAVPPNQHWKAFDMSWYQRLHGMARFDYAYNCAVSLSHDINDTIKKFLDSHKAYLERVSRGLEHTPERIKEAQKLYEHLLELYAEVPKLKEIVEDGYRHASFKDMDNSVPVRRMHIQNLRSEPSQALHDCVWWFEKQHVHPDEAEECNLKLYDELMKEKQLKLSANPPLQFMQKEKVSGHDVLLIFGIVLLIILVCWTIYRMYKRTVVPERSDDRSKARRLNMYNRDRIIHSGGARDGDVRNISRGLDDVGVDPDRLLGKLKGRRMATWAADDNVMLRRGRRANFHQINADTEALKGKIRKAFTQKQAEVLEKLIYGDDDTAMFVHDRRLRKKIGNTLFEGVPLSDADKDSESESSDDEDRPLSESITSLRDTPVSTEIVHKRLCLVKDERDHIYNNAVIIGNSVITTWHTVSDKNHQYLIDTHYGSFPVEFKQIRSSNDLAIAKRPAQVPRSTKLAMRSPKRGEKVVLWTRMFNGEFTSMPNKHGPSACVPHNNKLWKYRISTVKGDCGGIVMAVSDGAVVGFHSHGGGNGDDFNYFQPVTNEVIRLAKGLDEQSITYDELLVVGNLPDETPLLEQRYDESSLKWKLPKELRNRQAEQQSGTNVSWFVDLLPTGRHLIVDQKYWIERHNTYDTKLEYNPTFEEWLHETNRYDKFKPYLDHYMPSYLAKESAVKDLAKYDKPNTQIDEEILAIGVMWVIRMLEPFISTTKRMSPEEVLDTLNTDTAAGALYGMKKSDYLQPRFGFHTEEDVQQYIKYWGDYMLKPDYIPGVWQNSLKDELRHKDKVAQMKTRTFTAAPIDFVVGAKTWVDDFNLQFYDAHLKVPSTVGITKFFRGWHNLYYALERENGLYFAADMKQYDSSLSRQLFAAIYTIRCHFANYDQDFCHALHNIYREIVHTPICTQDGSIIYKMKGNNSGQPSTVVDNTLILMLLFCCWYYESAPEEEKDFATFRNNFTYFCNGDDNIGSVSPDMQRWFNLDQMVQWFSTNGITMEVEDITSNLMELSYMSLSFAESDVFPGDILPLASPERLVATLQWSKAKEPGDWLTVFGSVLINGFAHEELCQEVREYIRWYVRKFHDLYNTTDNWRTGLCSILDNDTIARLHYCYELKPVDLKLSAGVKSEITNTIDKLNPQSNQISLFTMNSEVAENLVRTIDVSGEESSEAIARRLVLERYPNLRNGLAVQRGGRIRLHACNEDHKDLPGGTWFHLLERRENGGYQCFFVTGSLAQKRAIASMIDVVEDFWNDEAVPLRRNETPQYEFKYAEPLLLFSRFQEYIYFISLAIDNRRAALALQEVGVQQPQTEEEEVHENVDDVVTAIVAGRRQTTYTAASTSRSLGVASQKTVRQCKQTISNILSRLFQNHPNRDMRNPNLVELTAIVFMELLIYFAHTGTSNQHTYDGSLTVAGLEIDYKEFRPAFMENLRPICRAHATLTYTILVQRQIVPEWGRKNGMPEQYQYYGFDFAEYTNGIPVEAMAALDRIREKTLERGLTNVEIAQQRADRVVNDNFQREQARRLIEEADLENMRSRRRRSRRSRD